MESELMRMNSIIMLLLAFVFGTGAVFLTKVWLNNQQSSLISPVEATVTPTATVVVAAGPLRFGNQLQFDNLREIAWPSGNVPTGTFSTKEELLEAGERYVIIRMVHDKLGFVGLVQRQLVKDVRCFCQKRLVMVVARNCATALTASNF